MSMQDNDCTSSSFRKNATKFCCSGLAIRQWAWVGGTLQCLYPSLPSSSIGEASVIVVVQACNSSSRSSCRRMKSRTRFLYSALSTRLLLLEVHSNWQLIITWCYYINLGSFNMIFLIFSLYTMRRRVCKDAWCVQDMRRGWSQRVSKWERVRWGKGMKVCVCVCLNISSIGRTCSKIAPEATWWNPHHIVYAHDIPQHFTQTPVANPFQSLVVCLLIHGQIHKSFAKLLADMINKRRVIAGPWAIEVAKVKHHTTFDRNNGLVAVDVCHHWTHHSIVDIAQIRCR